jgi:hypothetical protein
VALLRDWCRDSLKQLASWLAIALLEDLGLGWQVAFVAEIKRAGFGSNEEERVFQQLQGISLPWYISWIYLP